MFQSYCALRRNPQQVQHTLLHQGCGLYTSYIYNEFTLNVFL